MNPRMQIYNLLYKLASCSNSDASQSPSWLNSTGWLSSLHCFPGYAYNKALRIFCKWLAKCAYISNSFVLLCLHWHDLLNIEGYNTGDGEEPGGLFVILKMKVN